MTTPEYPSLGITRLPRTILELSGADRVTFLHNLCTNDIKAMSPGDVREAFITNVQGRILGHLFAAVGEPSLSLSTVAGQAETLLSHFDRYLITEDVQMVDRSASHVQIAVCGDEAPRLVGQLTEEVTDRQSHVELIWENARIHVTHAPLVGPHCSLITCERVQEDAICRAILDRGAKNLSWEDFERQRIEAGFPWYGIDFGEDNLPQEIDRNEQAISFTKGCYLGQETVARIDALGRVNKHLVGFKADTAELPIARGDIEVGGKAVGQVSSSVFSPRLNSHIALGIVRREFSKPGTTIEIGGQPATVVSLPFS